MCVSVCLRVCVFVHEDNVRLVCVRGSMTSMCVRLCLSVCLSACVFVHRENMRLVCVCVVRLVFVCVCVGVGVCVCVCVCVYERVCVYNV